MTPISAYIKSLDRLVEDEFRTPITPKGDFLPKYLIMLDGEFTGVDPDNDSLLEVAMMKLRLNNDMQYESFDDPLVIFFQYNGTPQNEFQKKYLSEIYKKCNASKITSYQARDMIHKWLGDLKGKVSPVGDCVPSDIEFLYKNKCIDHSYFDKNGKPVDGTFYYEFFDMNAPKALARQKLGRKFDVPGMSKETVHEALADCKDQLLELNVIIKTLLG